MKYCTNCGAKLADENKFCQNCGSRQNDISKDTPSKEPNSPSSANNTTQTTGKSQISQNIIFAIKAIIGLTFFSLLAVGVVKGFKIQNSLEKAIIPFKSTKSDWSTFKDNGGLNKESNWNGIHLSAVQLSYNNNGILTQFSGEASIAETSPNKIKDVINNYCNFAETEWSRFDRPDGLIFAKAQNSKCKASYQPVNRQTWLISIDHP